MYTFLCRVFHFLHSKPKTVVLVSFALSLASLYQVKNLEIRTAFSDLFPSNLTSVQLLNQVEEKFGGLGNLVLVVHSPNPNANKEAIHFLADHLRLHPDVNFLEYRTEKDFYKAHKLLYISLSDLQEVEKRIETGFWLTQKKRNPLIIDLLSEEERESSSEEMLSFADLEDKYFSRLQEYLGTPDEKVLVFKIYPKFDITDIRRCRAFHQDVKTTVSQFRHLFPHEPEILFTGEVMRNIQDEGRLYSEVIDSGKRALVLMALLLFVYFIRIPFGVLLALVPLSMAIIWTLALTYSAIGHLSLVTASLSLILVGIGLDACIHLLARYREERRKNLGADVAFETIILETGPAISTGVLVSAAAFFTLLITDFKGFSQFGLMAGVGLICTLAAVLIVFPCMLILVESTGLIPVFGCRMYNHTQFESRTYAPWRRHMGAVAAITLLCCHQGLQSGFEFHFDRLGFPNRNLAADSLLQSAGELLAPPAVIITPDHEEGRKVADAIRKRIVGDTLTPTIQDVTTMTDLLPADQEEKLAIIAKLKETITPDIIAISKEPLLGNLKTLQAAWNVSKLTTADLPENYQKKFLGRDTATGQFTFIFPSVNLRSGWNNIEFANDVRDVPVNMLTGGKVYHASGTAVVRADLLKMIIPDTRKAVILAFLTLLALVLLDVKSVRGTVVIIVPLLLCIVWTLGLMKVFGLRLNYFNLVAFPAMLGSGIHNTMHLYHRYLEEGQGSMFFVLRRTGEVIFVASLTAIAGFLGFCFSEHGGLSSLGYTAVIGLFMGFLAPMLFMPVVVGFLEERRMGKSGKPAPIPFRPSRIQQKPLKT